MLCLGVARAAAAQDPGPIRDNSFLVEEAYNQDPGVVQHLQLFIWNWKSGGWAWTFTQEWPVPRADASAFADSAPLARGA